MTIGLYTPTGPIDPSSGGHAQNRTGVKEITQELSPRITFLSHLVMPLFSYIVLTFFKDSLLNPEDPPNLARSRDCKPFTFFFAVASASIEASNASLSESSIRSMFARREVASRTSAPATSCLLRALKFRSSSLANELTVSAASISRSRPAMSP